MSTAGTGAVRLRPVEISEVPAALSEALAGGPPIAPLPHGRNERERALAMLRPDQPVVEDDPAVIVSTSGSTGQPKGVVLSRAAITASAAATHDHLGGPGDWVLALPTHYVAGLMVWARALVAGTRVAVAQPDLRDLDRVAATVSEPRYLSVVSTQLVRALNNPATAQALTGFAAVLLGGGPVDPTLRRRAAELGVNVVSTYGMSETCGGCVYDGLPLPGVQVEVLPDERVAIAGAVLFSGYRLRDDLTATALVGGALRTQDRGRWQDGRLAVLGRMDDVVISGGLNVDLAAVERRAQEWPVVDGRELVVLGVADDEWGTQIVAVSDGDGSIADLREFLLGSMPAYAAPRRLVRLDPLPRTSSGKVDRQAIRSLLTKGSR